MIRSELPKSFMAEREDLAVAFSPLGVSEVKELIDFTPNQDGESGDWFVYCMLENYFYEYPTREYVEGLSTYLADRIRVIASETGEEVRILEVAAGEGRLTFLLNQRLSDMGCQANLVAVDDFSWWGEGKRGIHPSISESLDYDEALKKYNPHIVLGAWLPGKWSKSFRQCPTVEEYILIGEPGMHAAPEDWGQHADSLAKEKRITGPTEYEQDGFERIDLEHLRPYQLCYKSVAGNMHRSATIVFRRVK